MCGDHNSIQENRYPRFYFDIVINYQTYKIRNRLANFTFI